jgi:hypothetical protein
VRIIRCERSRFSTTLLLSIGLVKLGQPVPLSNLVDRREQRLAGNHVDVDAGLVVVPVLAGERPFGAVLLGHVVLLGRQRVDRCGVLSAHARSGVVAVFARHGAFITAYGLRLIRACTVDDLCDQLVQVLAA